MDNSFPEKYKLHLLLFLTVFVYFWNFWLNNIWIPNESFYGEAVREMFETGNFLDIYYNYEPRFNKPPMTYWVIALSVFIFGLKEFAVRLPVVLMALGSSFLTYKIAITLYDRKTAIYSFFAMALSFQFIINSRYASPEVPLVFFFTLTIYLFIKGYKENRVLYLYLSYITLGLTVLTKGFPYYIVIGGIVGLYLLSEGGFNWKRFLKGLVDIKALVGVPISVVIGMSWVVYMHVKFGQSFWDVYNQETFKRALGESSKLSDVIFYPTVILWGFLPYSLMFYYGFFNSFREFFKKHSLIFSWFAVMFVIFTVAKGKIPTYFIQAHTPMAILVGYYLANHNPEGFKRYLFYASLCIPTFLIVALNIYMVYSFNLDYLLYLFAVFPILYILKFKDLRFAPFVSILMMFLIFVVSILPFVERYRPYREIGQIILDNLPDRSVPLIVEGTFFHNMPFYARRKVLRDYSPEMILDYASKNRHMVALVSPETLDKIPKKTVLWQGYIYNSSESRFAVFLNQIKRLREGKDSKFIRMYLIYKN